MFVFFVLIEDSFKSSELGFKFLIKVKKRLESICSDKHRKLETLLWFEKTELRVLQWWLIFLDVCLISSGPFFWSVFLG